MNLRKRLHIRAALFATIFPVNGYELIACRAGNAMKKHEVKKIIVPINKNLAVKPSITAEDNITEAIEVLLKNDLKQIAVTEKDVVVGMIRLEDALKAIGLEGDLKTKETKIVVVHGRKIAVRNEV